MNKEYLKRKESIIISAIDILDELGIRGLTTKEIARRQGITEPAVYKQFTGKLDIVLTILDRFAAFDDVIRNTIIDNCMGCKDGIYYFIKGYSEYYENYPQITTVMFSFDVYRYETQTDAKMKKIMNDRHSFMSSLVKNGQESGEIRKDINYDDLAGIILGLIWSSAYSWKINNCKYSLKEKIINAVDAVLKG